MSQTFEFYNARANESAAEAKVAVLENVRERARRSEATWRSLANQARAVADERAKVEQQKADRRAQEALDVAPEF